jgi:hypothetical protein
VADTTLGPPSLSFCFSAARICFTGECMIALGAAKKPKNKLERIDPDSINRPTLWVFSHPDLDRSLCGLAGEVGDDKDFGSWSLPAPPDLAISRGASGIPRGTSRVPHHLPAFSGLNGESGFGKFQPPSAVVRAAGWDGPRSASCPVAGCQGQCQNAAPSTRFPHHQIPVCTCKCVFPQCRPHLSAPPLASAA